MLKFAESRNMIFLPRKLTKKKRVTDPFFRKFRSYMILFWIIFLFHATLTTRAVKITRSRPTNREKPRVVAMTVVLLSGQKG